MSSFANNEKVNRTIKGADPLSKIKKEKSIHTLMTEFFDKLLLDHGNRLVIIIDELDRCKPSYAVQLLERIKHYFEDERITFVFSINIEQLQHTIKKYYGDEFNGSRYIDRFFDLRISLPQANLQKYFEKLEFKQTSYIFDEMCYTVIKYFRFELREIAKYVSFAKISAYNPTHNNGSSFSFSDGRALLYALHYVIPVMIGLKIYDESTYTGFISGRNNTPLIDIFHSSASDDMFNISELLNSHETYDSKNVTQEIHLVSPEDKIIEVYNALFAQDYNGSIRTKTIGSLGFSEKTRDIIMRTISLLSDFADYTN